MLAVMLVQGLTGLGGVALAALIGRISGLDTLGTFTVMFSLLGALGILAQRGQGALIFRTVAWTTHAEGNGAALTLLGIGLRRIVFSSLALGALGSMLLWSGAFGEPFPYAVIFLPVLLLGLATLAVFAGYSRGKGRIWLGPIFETGGISLFTVVALLALHTALGTLQDWAILMALFMGMLCLLAFMISFVKYDFSSVARAQAPDQKVVEELRQGQIAFILIGASVYLCQTGSFLIAAPFLSTSDLGLLRMAERLALLVSFPMLAIRPLFGPSMVRLARTANIGGLKMATVQAMAASGGFALLVLLILSALSGEILMLLGEEFTAALPFLYVMLATQFVVATLGPLSGLLHMTNRERASAWINVATLAIALILFPLLVSMFGPMGFALAYAATNTGRMAMISGFVVLAGVLKPEEGSTAA